MSLHVSPTALADGQSYHCYVFDSNRIHIKQIIVKMDDAKRMYPDRYLMDAVCELAKMRFQQDQ